MKIDDVLPYFLNEEDITSIKIDDLKALMNDQEFFIDTTPQQRFNLNQMINALQMYKDLTENLICHLYGEND